ncbi:MAG: putative DNA binding domain-containing protein [Eubacterium sp.]|nr:putative DNA binding domain-containing protein [Eubacterium sp.]
MTIEEIMQGESKNVEFKAMLPKDSSKYIKTIIAFANTQGGHLVIGVDDVTRKVIGVDRDFAFQIMDSIANAIADSCVPQIVPDIELQTIEGCTVIVVTVAPEPDRPYYLKAKGKENGTFIRLAGTSRPADIEKIKELELEGAHVSWDELTCIGYDVTDKEIKKLCGDIMKYREIAGLPGRKVTSTQLVNWKLLKKAESVLLASNAFVLLVSDYFPFSKTQCAVFKGTERTVFLDKREYAGPIYEQIENATAFVLRNIRLGATIEGLIRKENYELPIEAIREMIINAHCHRNLTDASCVQVAVYDDRLEVTSPGGLYNGLTYEEIMSGHSKLRNRTIANVFNQMGLIEAWGTGIRRIKEAAKGYGLPIPEFLAFDDMFRVNLYRSPILELQTDVKVLEKRRRGVGETSEKHRRNIGEASEKRRRSVGEASKKQQGDFVAELNDTQEQILELLLKDARLSAVKLAEQIGVAGRTVEANIKKLKDQGILIRHGSPKNGYWEVMR